jgi:Kef-type K+ transport system membrane component KefB
MRLPLILSSILLVLGIAHVLGVSLLLAGMSLGFFTRLYARASAQRLFNPVYSLEEMIFLLFFVIAGTHFDLDIFQQNLDLIFIYVITRILGKTTGSALGARLTNAPSPIAQWLGVGLIPQAGVAVGLALVLSHQQAYAETGYLIVNVILGTTLLYELVGPIATRFALKQAGELSTKREKHRHEGF